MPQLCECLTQRCRTVAANYSVAHDIHDDDYIFWNIHDAMQQDERSLAVDQYFRSGAETALWMKSIVDDLPGLKPTLSLLDFASGYGRVARHLSGLLPKAHLVTSDIHGEAVSFNRSINLPSVQSSNVPEKFDPGQTFDVIFAISFFTHMPSSTWGRWLRAIAKHLKPSGKLVFTTHGRVALKPMGVTDVPSSGFVYHPVSEQKDLDIQEYGGTTTFFEYVSREVLNADLRMVWFKEAGAGYQDLVVVTPA